jgi:alpha-mannosidase
VKHALLVICVAIAFPAGAHTIYVANDDHTDYGWNDTTTAYDASLLAQMDFFLDQIAATAANTPAEQARFSADIWYYLWLYQHNRTVPQFQRAMDAMKSGHLTVALNPFVVLFGALPTEAAIRAGNWPGRLERQFGVPFLTAQEMENDTIPWGIAQIWAASGVKYSWKGICACADMTPWGDRNDADVFRWQAPDGRELLMKWYRYGGNSQSIGGYAEMRANQSETALSTALTTFSAAGLPTGLFGLGWDDVDFKGNLVPLVQAYNMHHLGGDQAVSSNEIDFFEDLESQRNALAVDRGGWGNDWDLWPQTLAARTAQTRRAVERLHSAELLSSVAQLYDQTFWAPQQSALESALVDYFKYFEHSWSVSGTPPLSGLVNDKKTWSQSIDLAISQVEAAAEAKVKTLFTTPAEDRVAVWNPLGFARSDAADLPVSGAGPFVVTDVATGAEVPSQPLSVGGKTFVRIVATEVPSLGWRVYKIAAGTPAAQPDAATITGSTIESPLWKVVLGTRGQITSLLDKTNGSRELAGAGLNDWGSGTAQTPMAENVGPVSATLRVDVSGTPARRVRITLYRGVDRVDISDEVLANFTSTGVYKFDVNLTSPQIRFEEVGAIARPGLKPAGDFLPGTRADWMTLNHFVSFTASSFTVTVSSRDASAMKVGASTPNAFDLTLPQVSVMAMGNVSQGRITDQGGDSDFVDELAVSTATGAFSGAAAMKASLRHQNPLVAIALGQSQTGSITAATGSLFSLNAPNVVVTAFKPAEDAARGLVARAWELDGAASTALQLDATAFMPSAVFETTAIETDTARATVAAGVVSSTIGANEIKTWRLVPGAFGDSQTDGGTVPDALMLPQFDDAGNAITWDLAGGPSGGDGGLHKSAAAGCGCHHAAGGSAIGVSALLTCAAIVLWLRSRRRA